MISCVDLLKEVEDRSPRIIPEKLRLLENTRRMFTIHFGSKSKKNFPKFVVYKATTVSPLALPAPPIKTADEGTSTAMSPVDEDTCASEITQESATPPPITPESLEKVDRSSGKAPTSVKRELFGTSDS